ncbi:hypothetical protein LNV08_22320 [Paucibacter sp. TC2R-5]|nr:hypothetical protein [Paucibacter sp. TC2R-5]
MEPLIPDSFVLFGRSKKGADRREHVVPRVVLCREAHDMFGRGESIKAVADLLRKYLKIVLISIEEKHHLDHEIGLKQRMPDGWSFEEGCTFARLHAANIEFDAIPSGVRACCV